MTLNDLLKVLGTRTVQLAKQNLKASKRMASGNLYNSLDWYFKDNGELDFDMEDYGDFINRGVRKRGPFKNKGKKMPPKDSLLNWMRIKGIDPKYEYAIRKSIFNASSKKFRNQGKPTWFFTNAYDKATKEFDKQLNLFINEQLDKLDKVLKK